MKPEDAEGPIDPTMNLLDLSYKMTWSSDDHFAIWESEDGSAIQFTGPEGQVLYVSRRRHYTSAPKAAVR